MMNFVFIFGPGRSGTSLLHSIVASHSTVHGLPETGLMQYLLSELKTENALREGDNHKIINKIENYPKFRRFRFKNEAHQLTSVCSQANDLKSIMLNLTGIMDDYKNEPFILEKDPLLLNFSDDLEAYFPGCKQICLLRDPRDVLLSRQSAQWSKKHSVLRHSIAIYSHFKQAEKLYYNKGQLLHFIKYEKLVNEPEDTIKKLCNFLELNFEKSMLEYQKTAKLLTSDEELQWKKNTFIPIINGNTNKWLKNKKNFEYHLLEYLCRGPMQTFGYLPANLSESHSSFRKILVSALSLVIIVSYKLITAVRN